MSAFDGFFLRGEMDSIASSYDNASARSAATGAQSRARSVERDVQRLEMLCEAMWSLMKEKAHLTDDDLMAKMAELDLSDGKADGRKAEGGPVICPQCSRPNNRRLDYCMYCGEMIRKTPF